MNGYFWRVVFVDPMLVDRSGTLTIGTTDPSTLTVYLSDGLYGQMLLRVLLHEIGHCALFSFNLLDDIHLMTYPAYWEEMEEWVCNFIADYGLRIFSSAYSVVGSSGLWTFIMKRTEGNSAEGQMLMGLAHDRIEALAISYIDRGYITSEEYENLYKYLYTPYKKLGGNGSAERLMNAVMKLPLHSAEYYDEER